MLVNKIMQVLKNLFGLNKKISANDIAVKSSNNKAKTLDAFLNNGYGNIYSTNEIVIGRWIDGKPIYRKVLNSVGLAGNTKKSIAYNIDNLDKIWIENGFAINALRIVTVPMVGYNGNVSDKVDVWIEKQENVVKLYSNGGWGKDWTFYIILNYTKSTDQ